VAVRVRVVGRNIRIVLRIVLSHSKRVVLLLRSNTHNRNLLGQLRRLPAKVLEGQDLLKWLPRNAPWRLVATPCGEQTPDVNCK
jgi:hypothetical protein